MKAEFRAIENGGLWGGRLLMFETLPSTNRWAMDNLAACRNGDVISAVAQTAGKGRFARSWLCPDNRGLALSAVLGPAVLKEAMIPKTGFAAAMALRETLATFGIEAMLKWPNDVIAGGKKISGILSELDSISNTVVLGIGLNVNVTTVDLRTAGLEDTATSMLLVLNRESAVDEVRGRLISFLQTALDNAVRHGFRGLAAGWARHDWLAGHAVEIHGAQGPVSGIYDGMDPAGALCLIDSSGSRHTFSAGDVVRLRKTSAHGRVQGL